MKKTTICLVIFFALSHVSYAVNLNLIAVLGEERGFVSPAGITSDANGNFYVAIMVKIKLSR